MKFRKNAQKSRNIHFQRVPNVSPPPHIGGSGPIQEKSRRLCHFGVFPCHFGGPQSHICKIHSGILEGCGWVTNAQEPSQLDEWLRSRRRSSPLMALMAHQNSLILLFLWPHSMDLVDLKCVLDRYSVWTSSVQIWNRSIHWRVGNVNFRKKF